MIVIHNGLYVSSVELYEALSINIWYYRWVSKVLKNNIVLVEGKDYIRNELYENPNPSQNGRVKHDYHITIPVAIAICIRQGTLSSKKTKEQLERVLRPSVQKK